MSGPVPIRSSARVRGFTYAIRNIVGEAKKVEAAGRRVRYLNIGDPIPFGFHTPPHLVDAVSRAMRDGHNGYTASAGIQSAREAVADEYASRGMPVSPDRVILTSGTSEGIELALGALADAGEDVLVPTPTYPLYTAVLAKIGARAVYYRTDPSNQWLPDLDDLRRKMTPATRALVVIDPNNPDGRGLPGSHTARADRHRGARERADPGRRGVRRSRVRRPGPAPRPDSIPTRRSCRSRRCRRRTSRLAGARGGWPSGARAA